MDYAAIKEPWVIMGDFNEALWQFEHLSATRRGERQMQDFRETLEACDLQDAWFSGLPSTFDNRQKGDRNVKVKLDRVVSTRDWSHLFPAAEVIHLVSPRSDNCPLLVQQSLVEQRRRQNACNMRLCGNAKFLWRTKLEMHGEEYQEKAT